MTSLPFQCPPTSRFSLPAHSRAQNDSYHMYLSVPKPLSQIQVQSIDRIPSHGYLIATALNMLRYTLVQWNWQLKNGRNIALCFVSFR